MHNLDLILTLTGGFIAALAFGYVTQRIGLSPIVGYLLAGVALGPNTPGFVASKEMADQLSEIGVILLMFTIGLELRLSAIARVGLPAALTALFEVGLAISLGTLVAGLLGFDPISALFAGACLGISSTMLVAKAFEELGWKGGFTEIVFAILVFEDLIAILLLVILAGIAGVGFDAGDVALTLAKLAGFSRIGEKVVEHRPRKYGVSKFGISRFINGFLDILTIFFMGKFGKKPMHFFGLWGSLFFLIGLAFSIYLIVSKIIYFSYPITNRPGFYLAMTSIIIGMQLFLAGFIGELISRNANLP